MVPLRTDEKRSNTSKFQRHTTQTLNHTMLTNYSDKMLTLQTGTKQANCDTNTTLLSPEPEKLREFIQILTPFVHNILKNIG